MPAGAPVRPKSPLPDRPQRSRRRTHLIRENARNNAPNIRVYVDTEAVIARSPQGEQRQTLWFGWACFERARPDTPGNPLQTDWHHFTTAESFFTRLEAHTFEKSCTYVYAHNWSYDAAMLSLSTMAATHGWTITEYVPANHLLWLTMRKGSRTLKFIDTLNYFAMPLEALGNQIGVKKTITEEYPQPAEWWSDYCKQDVEVIREAMHQYFALIIELDLGAYRATLAGQAYGAWRHRFMHHPVMILADERVEALERSAYHGGRSEVFYDLPINEPVFGFDVNSMYPWVMNEHEYPTQKISKGNRGTPAKLRELLAHYAVVARVTVTTDEPVYPYASGNRVLYPVGTFETSLSTPELRYALDHNHLRSVHEWVAYLQAPIFREYVTELYQLRLKYRAVNNLAFAFLVKIMLNSLYGKFGQRGFKWERCTATDASPFDDFVGNCDPDGASLTHRRRFGEMWHHERNLEAYESFPAIAAHVTAYARMALWQLRTEAGDKNVYYCDTDSLYVNATGRANLAPRLGESELGKLKLERECTSVHFRAPKDYVLYKHDPESQLWKVVAYDDEGVQRYYYEKIKGVRAKAVKLSDTSFEQIQFESYDRALARGEDGVIVVRTVIKQLARRNLQSRGEGIGWRQPLHVDDSVHPSDRLPWQF